MKTGVIRTISFSDERMFEDLDEQLENQEEQDQLQEEQTDDDGKYIFAEEVQAVAAKLISDYHTHLAEARIAYLFRKGEWNSKGRTQFGKACKAPEQWAFMSGFELLVIINKTVWDYADEKKREAVVDHELCHIEKDIDAKGNPKWITAHHDVEEFSIVIQRHGLWSRDIRQFFAAAAEKQLSLEDMVNQEVDEE